MLLVLTCPECGHGDWEEEQTEEGGFICKHCGEVSFPEDMCACSEDELLK